MGGIYYNKALLLDEREIQDDWGDEIDCFDDLCEAAISFAGGEVGDYDYPMTSYLGCSSERYNTSRLLCCDQRSMWLENGQAWSQSLARIMKNLGGLDPQVVETFLRTGERQTLTTDVSHQAAALIADEQFARVRDMMTALENFKQAGLPCFRDVWHLTAGGDDDAYDLRERDWGAGRRVIVEMAFVWG